MLLVFLLKTGLEPGVIVNALPFDLLDCVSNGLTLVILGDAYVLDQTRQTVVRIKVSPSSFGLALLTDEWHSLAVGLYVCGVFSSAFVGSSVAALKDTLLRLEKAVLFVSNMVIVKINLAAICAIEIDSQIRVSDLLNDSALFELLLAVWPWADFIWLSRDARFAKDRIAVFIRGWLDRKSLTHEAYDRLIGKFVDARLGSDRG